MSLSTRRGARSRGTDTETSRPTVISAVPIPSSSASSNRQTWGIASPAAACLSSAADSVVVRRGASAHTNARNSSTASP